MKWIGLTGGIASGKSTVAQILRELGYPVVDADELAHRALEPESSVFSQIINAFGPGIIGADSKIDRKRLGQIVFSDQEKLRQLESLVHPEVQRMAAQRRRELESQGFDLGFYDVPLLYEKNLQDRFDSVFVVFSPESVQRERLKQRNQMTDDEITQRLAAQISMDEKQKLAPFVIRNDGSRAELKAQVKAVLAKLKDE